MRKLINQRQRSWLLRQFRQWHWISSAICLVGMFLFAITGLTLNHAAAISADPQVTARSGTLPPSLIAALKATPADAKAPAPDAVRAWIKANMGVTLRDAGNEWSDDEIYAALPRPGGDAFLTIDRSNGAVAYELTDRGWISYLNDLHKGRNTGDVWFWFIDVFAVACLVFCITGLVLLQLMAEQRKFTWPVVSAGLVIPLLIAVLFIHM
ncbi:MAG TPA: PepSY-associated TM helix domain-containing protein [Rhizomicrobium sp.]|nr:PepSY-associated TM helix domain-containing protein [Rhizomicrobium sp.]